ncbi:MAG: SurA N-terminal domain-containing protein [Parvibaculum sp.]|uniref:peptidylprolyl isomerase n=1 Tax=Parvibaculum sp. TaxID=2024848 RepID=UPI0025F7AD8E|nr:peptidylprolyl isomerase [Parvibaculum sp.]MCE9651442.1 SurA N-terminal domain-containing protein [Parvibaculum sp.]
MLDTLIRGASGWVAKGLMGLLVVSFAVWGVNDVFRGYSSTSVAEVGGTSISVDQYQRAVENQTREFAQRLGQPLTRAQAHQYGIDSAALSQLIGLAALDEGIKKTGLTASDQTVARNITSDPAMTGTFGKFDRQGFDQRLQQMGITEKSFIEDRRKFLARTQLNDALQAGIKVPATLLDAISTYQGETRVASYIILPPEAVGTIADPDDKALQAYYEKAAIHFTTPETRDFSVLTLNPADLAATVTISDEQLETAYEQRRAEFDVPEKRKVQQIPFSTMDAAKDGDARLKKGEPVEKIVGELGLEMKDVDLGQVTRAQMISPAIADAAFALKTGEYSEPVQGPLGPVILHVTDVSAAKPSSFDAVKDRLREMMASESARNEVYNVQNDIEDARAGGAALEDIAAKNNLKIVKFNGVTAEGLTADGKKPDGLPDYKDLLSSVFENQQGDQIPPGDTGEGGYYWVRVDNVSAAALKPLKEVRPEVVKLWKTETRKAKLDELAQALVARGTKGEAIDKIASSVGRTALISPDIKRGSSSDTFSRLAVTRLFAVPQGGFTYGPVGFGDSLIVLQAKEINDPKPDVSSEAYKSAETNIADALEADLLVTLVVGYEKQLGTKVNTRLLDQLVKADSGQ